VTFLVRIGNVAHVGFGTSREARRFAERLGTSARVERGGVILSTVIHGPTQPPPEWGAARWGAAVARTVGFSS
jgi:hypothetical protein